MIPSARWFALREVGRMSRAHPVRCIVTAMFCAVASILGMVLWSLAASLQALSDRTGFDASVFVTPGASKREIDALQAQLKQRAEVHQVEWPSREVALRSLSERNGSAWPASLKGALLPEVLIVTFRPNLRSAVVEAAVVAIGKLPGVESVAADLQWHRNMSELVGVGRTTLWWLLALTLATVSLGLLALVGLHVDPPRAEVELLLLSGAEPGFVARPLGYLVGLTVFVGAAAGVAVWLLLAVPAGDFVGGSKTIPAEVLILPPPTTFWVLPVALGLLAAVFANGLVKGRLRRLLNY